MAGVGTDGQEPGSRGRGGQRARLNSLLNLGGIAYYYSTRYSQGGNHVWEG